MTARTRARERRRSGGRRGKSAPRRVIGYRRVSSEEQRESGLSLAAQSRRLRAWAEAQGYELLRIDSDEGVSGGIAPDKRPGLSAALEAIRRGEADGLVAVKLDRLSRRVRDMLDLADACQREGWLLATVEESLNTGSAAGRFVLSVLASMAEWERGTIAERTQAALDQLARDGRRRGGEAPFGYRHSGKQVVRDPGERATLARMLRLRRDGVGQTEIARRLNREKRFRRSGKPWTQQTVWRTLDNHDAWLEARQG